MAIGDVTDARNSCWDAVLNWPALQNAAGQSLFKRKYKFDDDDSPEVMPTKDQLPAIMLFPNTGLTDQVLNRTSQHVYNLAFTFFTKTWNLATSDTYWKAILKSLFQSASAATPGVPYVKAATGFDPFEKFRVSTERVKIDKTKALVTTLEFSLRVRFDPRS